MSEQPEPTVQRIFSRETELHEENVVSRGQIIASRRVPANSQHEIEALKAQIAMLLVTELELNNTSLLHSQKLDSLTLSSEKTRHELDALKIQFALLQSAPSAPGGPESAFPRNDRPQMKMAPDPKPFSGKPGTLETFLRVCEKKFDAEPLNYSMDKDKILYAGFNLQDKALAWYGAFRKPSNPNVKAFQNWEDFTERMRTLYGSHNPEQTAISELKRLKQTRSVMEYTAEFERLAAGRDWPDSLLLSLYQDGLSHKIQNHLLYLDEDTIDSLSSIIRVAKQIDRRLREHQDTRNSPQSNFPSARREPRVSAESATTMSPMPMDLDATVQRGPLTKKQKEDRRSKNLCLYCGGSGHRISECRSKPKVMRQNS